MSLEINALTKIYKTQKAIDALSFEVQTGEIVGLLGPNGAGKSTTMKILTCFIPPSSGSAKVCGFDVEKQSIEVRKNIGYLPESNPLYYEMYVKEYLAYVAGIYGIKKPKKRISEMIELTGLGVEQHKKIGQLSKGYKQRVGLAQAMIHDPKVLILDEPTSGLDPNQLLEIRALIQEIGKTKTIMLSTHIMQEVEALCQRVIIINRGKMVADNSVANLQNQIKTKNVVLVEFQENISRSQLIKIKGIDQAKKQSENIWQIQSNTNNLDLRKTIFDFAVQNNLSVLSLQKQENNLEQIFRELTS